MFLIKLQWSESKLRRNICRKNKRAAWGDLIFLTYTHTRSHSTMRETVPHSRMQTNTRTPAPRSLHRTMRHFPDTSISTTELQRHFTHAQRYVFHPAQFPAQIIKNGAGTRLRRSFVSHHAASPFAERRSDENIA